jgi:hypothetical protein
MHPIADTHSFLRQAVDKSGCLAASASDHILRQPSASVHDAAAVDKVRPPPARKPFAL